MSTRLMSRCGLFPTVSVGLMFEVIEPLGEIVTTLPVGSAHQAGLQGRASSHQAGLQGRASNCSISPTTCCPTCEPPGC